MKNKPNIVCIIPARSGSKSIVDKNIKLLNGQPLIAFSVLLAKKISSIDRVIVSTDSSRYADIALQYGAEVPFLRPSNISGDQSTDLDFFQHFLEWFHEEEKCFPDYMVNLRPTTPLRESNIVQNAINFFIKNSSEATALQSVQKDPESAYKSFEIEDNFLKKIFTGSLNIDQSHFSKQSYKQSYSANGYIDILKSEFIVQNNKLYGDKVLAYKTPLVTEVDSIEQFDYLEYQAKKTNTMKELFNE